jgi:hypothetical protein
MQQFRSDPGVTFSVKLIGWVSFLSDDDREWAPPYVRDRSSYGEI